MQLIMTPTRVTRVSRGGTEDAEFIRCSPAKAHFLLFGNSTPQKTKHKSGKEPWMQQLRCSAFRSLANGREFRNGFCTVAPESSARMYRSFQFLPNLLESKLKTLPVASMVSSAPSFPTRSKQVNNPETMVLALHSSPHILPCKRGPCFGFSMSQKTLDVHL